MKKGALVCCALALVLNSGCTGALAAASTPPAGSYRAYYAAGKTGCGAAAVDYEYRIPAPDTNLLSALAEILLSGPESELLASPFPEGVSVQRVTLSEGVLYLDFSEQYGALSGIDLTVANCCLALTFCQVEGVDAVRVTVEGKELPYFDARDLAAGDVVLTGDEEKPVYLDATLWFSRSDGAGLAVETRQVLKTEDETGPKAVLDALLAGPGPDREDLSALIPDQVQLQTVTVEDGLCIAAFSGTFLEGIETPQDARLRIYSVVNTLASSLETIQSVQIEIDGQPLPAMDSAYPAGPLEPDFSLEQLSNP